jgi:hypothetical protein
MLLFMALAIGGSDWVELGAGKGWVRVQTSGFQHNGDIYKVLIETDWKESCPMLGTEGNPDHFTLEVRGLNAFSTEVWFSPDPRVAKGKEPRLDDPLTACLFTTLEDGSFHFGDYRARPGAEKKTTITVEFELKHPNDRKRADDMVLIYGD